jgi:hypothetical protein
MSRVKFVHITAAMTVGGVSAAMATVLRLYALDAQGNVWEWDGVKWRTLPSPEAAP